MSAEQMVRNYILENFLFTNDTAALNSADSLLGKGIIDSTGAMELVHFLEEEFSIKVEDHEMVQENLDSVNNIVAYVSRKKVSSG
jgi:acyl carrier protein